MLQPALRGIRERQRSSALPGNAGSELLLAVPFPPRNFWKLLPRARGAFLRMWPHTDIARGGARPQGERPSVLARERGHPDGGQGVTKEIQRGNGACLVRQGRLYNTPVFLHANRTHVAGVTGEPPQTPATICNSDPSHLASAGCLRVMGCLPRTWLVAFPIWAGRGRGDPGPGSEGDDRGRANKRSGKCLIAG